MSLEKGPLSGRSSKKGESLLRGVLFGATVLGVGALGAESGSRNTLETVNSHFLSPAAIAELQKESGASPAQIAKLEALVRPLLLQELRRITGR